MGAVRQVLEESGFDMANYNEESFSFEKLLAEELEEVTPSSLIGHADIAIPPGPDQTDTSYAVEFVRSGKTLRCGSGENILDAAASAGMRLPSSCGQGICGTCKSSMLDGEVDMQHNGGIRPKEIAQGKILICCSTPLSNIRIDA
jgi:ferredoxin